MDLIELVSSEHTERATGLLILTFISYIIRPFGHDFVMNFLFLCFKQS